MCPTAYFSVLKTINMKLRYTVLVLSFITVFSVINVKGKHVKRDSLTNDTFYFRKAWPTGVVTYHISPHFNETEQRKLIDGMNEISEKCCVRFRPRKSQEQRYLSIVKKFGDGCMTEVVPKGNIQMMFMDPTWCLEKGRILHELMHSLGFTHEHQRPDRDRYVKVMWSNIQPKYIRQFTRKTYPLEETYGFLYDYQSILHYKNVSNYAAIDVTKPILLPKMYAPNMGQRKDLDARDQEKLNFFYNCRK